jgi:hypothetical protein
MTTRPDPAVQGSSTPTPRCSNLAPISPGVSYIQSAMDPISFRVSPLLREVAELKIEELDRQKQGFRHRYPDNKQIERFVIGEKLSSLVDDIRTFDPYLEDEKKLSAIARYVVQAREDESILETKLLVFDQQLQRKIARHLKRLHTSSLYAELLKESHG